MLLLLQIFRNIVNSTINILVFFFIAGSLSIVKTVFSHVWCEHSVETNIEAGDQLGQHVPVVKIPS